MFMLCADIEKVRQVLLDVLTNAVKFTPSGGHVSLACETDRAADVVQLSGTDTGRGIPCDPGLYRRAARTALVRWRSESRSQARRMAR